MLRETLKRNKGITLIALVVTIIVLLILAGISIAMLTGQNGILNRTIEAQEKTGEEQTSELVKLSVSDAISQGLGNLTDVNLKTALNNNIGDEKYEISGDAINGWILIVNGKEFKIDSTGKIKETTTKLPTNKETTPYFPDDTFTLKEGDLATGLVIKDANDNEYVWVEVPTTIYLDSKYNTNGTPSSANDWEKIKDCLKAYTVDYSNSSYKDTNTDGTTYLDDYKNMLKSVYINGGFWVGRYEAGVEGDTPRRAYTNLVESDRAVIKQNKLPFNYVTRDEAQTLATRMSYDGCTGSLIYGIQWDLILKYIETKSATTKNNLTKDSTTIGNYWNNLWNITNEKAKYSIYSGSDFSTCPYEKKSGLSVMLTTGADASFSLMNIYDIAGNVREWTKEFWSVNTPVVYRGGRYSCAGTIEPANARTSTETSASQDSIGFRVGLWK